MVDTLTNVCYKISSQKGIVLMIKLMVDSSSDMAENDIYDIMIPITVNIDGKEYFDGVNLDSNTFYRLLSKTSDFPRTAQPSPANFIDAFENIKSSGDELIYFALSSALSGTYQSAVMAKEMVGYDNIHIIDSKTATHMISVLVQFADHLRKQGLSAEQIVKRSEELKSKVKVLAGLDTLEYLKRGGRLSKASAAVGTLAQIKPIITVTENGGVEAIGKAIGKGKAIQFILEKLKEYKIDKSFPLYSLYTLGEENCSQLEEKLTAKGYSISKRLQVGSTIGAHVGTGVYGILFVIE